MADASARHGGGASSVAAAGWWLALLAAVLLTRSAADWRRPATDEHAFRQTQTALTAYWFARDGTDLLRPPLPVFGVRHPSVPFEFPAYQAVVAALAGGRAELVAAVTVFGRAVQFGAYLLVGWLGWRLVRSEFGGPTARCYAVYWLFTPFLVFWSMAVLIEFTACFLTLGYVALVRAWAREPRPVARGLYLGAATGAGVGACLVKVTTALTVAPVVAAALAWGWHRGRAAWPRPTPLGSVAVVAVPLLAGAAWVNWTDAVKRENALGGSVLVSSNLRAWNFGTLEQRTDPGAWGVLAGWVGVDFCAFVLIPVVALGVAAGVRDRRVWWAAAPAAVGPLTFFNLYCIHNYYWSAVTPSLVLLAAAGTVEAARRTGRSADFLAVGVAAGMWALVAVSSPVAEPHASRLSHYLVPFRDRPTDEQTTFLEFADGIKARTPPDAVLLVVGFDWNPQVAFYTERKVIMDWPPAPRQGRDEAIRAEHPGYVVVGSWAADEPGWRGRAGAEVWSHPYGTLYRYAPGE